MDRSLLRIVDNRNKWRQPSRTRLPPNPAPPFQGGEAGSGGYFAVGWSACLWKTLPSADVGRAGESLIASAASRRIYGTPKARCAGFAHHVCYPISPNLQLL